VFDRINHRPALVLFVNYPVQKVVDVVKFIRRDIQPLILMSEMFDFNETVGLFIEMIIGSDPVLVSDLSQCLHILDVGLANIDIKKDEVAVFFLPFDKIMELQKKTLMSFLL
jgi:hypothetical protein